MRRCGFILFFISLCLVITGCSDQTKRPVVEMDIPMTYKERTDLEYQELNVALPPLSASHEDNMDHINLIIEELNKMTIEKINTKVVFTFMSRGHLVYETLMQLSSGDSDIVYCGNHLAEDTNLPYLVSQGHVKDFSQMMKLHAPSLNEAFQTVEFFDLMKIGDGIYGVPLYMPYTNMPVAMIKKGVSTEGVKIETFDDIYTILINNNLQENKVLFYSDIGCMPIRSADVFSSIHDYYELPLFSRSGYLCDTKNDRIVRIEDSEMMDDIDLFLYYYDQYGADTNYENALNNTDIGIIITTFTEFYRYPSGDDSFDYYLLYKDKKFNVFTNVPVYVISSSSLKSERAIILLDFLFSDREANILASWGIENQNDRYENGARINMNIFSLMSIYNPQVIAPTRMNTEDFYDIYHGYLSGTYVPEMLSKLYKDYDLTKEYRSGLRSDEYSLKEREDLILKYIMAIGKEEKYKKFEEMIHDLNKTTDLSEKIKGFLESIGAVH